MYEYIELGKNTGYIKSPTNIGVIKIGEDEVCIIDSGNDKDAGRRIKRVLEEKGLKLSAIYITHSNADHIGGNKYLQGQTGCKIYAPGIECDMTNHPILEPSFLYGGYPFKELRHKFLLAKESRAEMLTDEVLPDGIKTIPLPGHFFDMAGFKTSDNVIFLADCLSSKETLDKYRIPFIYDVASYLETLEKVKEMEAKYFVPSHCEVTEDIRPLAEYNEQAVKEIGEDIRGILDEPLNFEEILKRISGKYGIELDAEQYVLVGSTVKSFLSWMREKGETDIVFRNNMLCWERS